MSASPEQVAMRISLGELLNRVLMLWLRTRFIHAMRVWNNIRCLHESVKQRVSSNARNWCLACRQYIEIYDQIKISINVVCRVLINFAFYNSQHCFFLFFLPSRVVRWIITRFWERYFPQRKSPLIYEMGGDTGFAGEVIPGRLWGHYRSPLPGM